MYLSIASLTVGLATACIVNAIPVASPNVTAPDPVNGSSVPRNGPDIPWSYHILPDTEPVAGDQQKAKVSAESLVDLLLGTIGKPHLEHKSPVFVGDPDHYQIRISSQVELQHVTCPCSGEAQVDRRRGELRLILTANDVHNGKIMENWVNHWTIRVPFVRTVE
ncbi:hypothetical protein F5876DRAFT_79913 [Lentinula aff. lateritia]|uniref:Uncharacterized protein n=1 Tax=Lentinula aff. lateritia TaxID=2804960 RepID=A0ACC1TRK9_9AGAR|nr:hypothetical protein F5876DRAFT_79913 [Lentinula aff. lateritia]